MPVTQYTAQSHLWLAMGISAFLLALALLGALAAWRAWKKSAPQRRFHRQLVDLCKQQADAIDWAIQEVTTPGLSDELTRLHIRYVRVMSRKGSEDEIE